MNGAGMSAGSFAPPPADIIDADVADALAEDIGPGDATASLPCTTSRVNTGNWVRKATP